jgi:hypothetical protein
MKNTWHENMEVTGMSRMQKQPTFKFSIHTKNMGIIGFGVVIG